MKEGLIMKSTGSWYDVFSPQDQAIYKGRLRGKLKLEGFKVTNPIAVGDWVSFQVEDANAKTVLITDLLERKNYLIRKSTHKTAHKHILAANIDQAVLIATLTFPRTSLGFIDRFLVSAESYDIPVVIAFNKIDLLDQEALVLQQELVDLYQSLGYESLLISAEKQIGIDDFRVKIQGKTSLIAGHSGVGKSTLLNLLAPDIQQKTNEVSTFANKGVHTTTFAEMFRIEAQTYLIDTPGIKELGLIEIANAELNHFFPEMRALIGQCKYYNCTHQHEPDCAVMTAFENGEIAESRYKSYLSILSDFEEEK